MSKRIRGTKVNPSDLARLWQGKGADTRVHALRSASLKFTEFHRILHRSAAPTMEWSSMYGSAWGAGGKGVHERTREGLLTIFMFPSV